MLLHNIHVAGTKLSHSVTFARHQARGSKYAACLFTVSAEEQRATDERSTSSVRTVAQVNTPSVAAYLLPLN